MTTAELPHFVVDFDYAVVRLATFQATRDSQPRLLFGTVTLLPSDRPAPESMTGVDSKSLKGTSGRVHFRRVVLRAREALSWYRSAGNGQLLTPVPAQQDEIDLRLDGLELLTSDFEDDPTWPTLGYPLPGDVFSESNDLENPAPFAANSGSRIHRRFGERRGYEILLGDQDAIGFLANRLHVNLADFPEYLGSLALVVPDPIIERIENFLIPEKDGQPEKSLFRLVARPGQRLDGLIMTLFERHVRMLSGFMSVDIPNDGVLTLERTEKIAASGYVITHPVHGVLAVQQPVHFLRQLSFSINTVGHQRKISVPSTDGKKANQTSYSVSEINDVSQSTVGRGLEETRRGRVFEAMAMRKTKAAARLYDQHWFEDGQREEALRFVRSLVAGARERVIVADAYFGFLQILQYLPAIARPSVPVTVLTSRLAFETTDGSDDIVAPPATETPEEKLEGAGSDRRPRPKAESERTRLEYFQGWLSNLRENGVASLDALILRGSPPALHDRFLVVDEKVWFLGNSLNALGTRASMILRVPDGEDIVRRLLKMASAATPFSEYVSERRAFFERKLSGTAES
ncbi:MAG TPA: VPA1262 family N-terminal domain-containing protein [Paraburkholderia sp.]|uniref:VPA1262 family N-terminal domain-containing protein n=1 Tax=Paraburkholderia sp. TaxID=1926495 RepID=UPI002ED1A2B5